MKISAFTFNIPFFVQTIENSQSQMVFDYIGYIILLICFMAASILMMLIPIILCYSMVNNFVIMIVNKRIIKEGTGIHSGNSKYLKSICDTYLNASSKFFKNLIALGTWNIYSFIYVFFGFNSFNDGLKEYFYFPFAILQSLSKDEIFDSIYKFQSNWLFMGAIIIITFSFSFFGKYLGRDIANNVIKKKGIEFTF